jgi:predicted ATPase
MRFTSVEISNWRNFTHAEIDLQARVFVVGPNASGKSNFLDVFRFLHDLVAVGGGFQEAVRRRGGMSKLRSLAARQFPNVKISVSIGDDETPERWSYQLEIESRGPSGKPSISREYAAENGRTRLDRPDRQDSSDPERLFQTHLENSSLNRKFRAIAAYFSSVEYFHIVPQLVRDSDRSVGRTNDPFGGDLVEQIAKTPSKQRGAFIRKIERALQVAVPQLEKLELWFDTENNRQRLRGKYRHWRPQGAWQTEETFSDGTLRLFGLMWALLADKGPILLEEPELSLHPAIVREIPRMFSRVMRTHGRQVIISTHSPDLLADDGIGGDEVLLLTPQQSEGTEIVLASKVKKIRGMIEAGFSIGESVLPEVAPIHAAQLSLFGK